MKTSPFSFVLFALGLAALLAPLSAAEAPVTAAELASRLNASRLDGTSYVRLRLETGSGGAIQIQTKERRTQAGTDLVYQILFPKERKGESVLLRKPNGQSARGTLFTPPDSTKTLDAAQLKEGLFGSALAYEDIIENFFAWGQQTIVGTEDIGRVSCQILESKPGKSDRSGYASVRSWIDTKRMVPLRVEKYNASGTPVVRIETTNVEKDDLDRHLPASLSITRGGKSSVLEGSRIKHGVALTDADFTPEGLKVLTTPR